MSGPALIGLLLSVTAPHISSIAEEPPHAPLLHAYAEVGRLIVCKMADRDWQERDLARRFDERLQRMGAKVVDESGADRAKQDIIVPAHCQIVSGERAFTQAHKATLKIFVDELRAWERRYGLQPDRDAS